MGIAEIGFTITTVMITITFTYLFLSIRSILELLKVMIDANTERHDEQIKILNDFRDSKNRDSICIHENHNSNKMDFEGVHQRLNSIITLITNAFPPPNLSEYDFVPPKKRDVVGVQVCAKGIDGKVYQGAVDMKRGGFLTEQVAVTVALPSDMKLVEDSLEKKEKEFPFYMKVLACIGNINQKVDGIIALFSETYGKKPLRYKVQAAIYLLKRKGFVAGSASEGFRRVK